MMSNGLETFQPRSLTTRSSSSGCAISARSMTNNTGSGWKVDSILSMTAQDSEPPIDQSITSITSLTPSCSSTCQAMPLIFLPVPKVLAYAQYQNVEPIRLEY